MVALSDAELRREARAGGRAGGWHGGAGAYLDLDSDCARTYNDTRGLPADTGELDRLRGNLPGMPEWLLVLELCIFSPPG